METWEEYRRDLERKDLERKDLERRDFERDDYQKDFERDRSRSQRLGWHRREKATSATAELEVAPPAVREPRAKLITSSHGRPEVRGEYQVDSARPFHRPALVEMRMLQRRLLCAVPDYLVKPLPSFLRTDIVDSRHEADLREIVDEMMASIPTEVIDAVFTWARARRARELVAMLREGAAANGEFHTFVVAPMVRLGREADDVDGIIGGEMRNQVGGFIDEVLPYLLLADAIADDGYRDPRLR